MSGGVWPDRPHQDPRMVVWHDGMRLDSRESQERRLAQIIADADAEAGGGAGVNSLASALYDAGVRLPL